ncbi:hypothetical protein Plhal304r1_c015g0054711 [Plasmopara halstedii]
MIIASSTGLENQHEIDLQNDFKTSCPFSENEGDLVRKEVSHTPSDAPSSRGAAFRAISRLSTSYFKEYLSMAVQSQEARCGE